MKVEDIDCNSCRKSIREIASNISGQPSLKKADMILSQREGYERMWEGTIDPGSCARMIINCSGSENLESIEKVSSLVTSHMMKDATESTE